MANVVSVCELKMTVISNRLTTLLNRSADVINKIKIAESYVSHDYYELSDDIVILDVTKLLTSALMQNRIGISNCLMQYAKIRKSPETKYAFRSNGVIFVMKTLSAFAKNFIFLLDMLY